MKKLLLILTLTAASIISLYAQNVSIPDANFKAYLVGHSGINTNADTEIQLSEAQAFTGTLYIGFSSISSLTGIEAFTSLSGLVCGGNSLTTLDLSHNTALVSVVCPYNSLTSLDFSANTVLSSVSVIGNNLTFLNVANGNNSNFTSFDATSNPNLTCIEVDDADYSTTNWTNKPSGASFSENCGTTGMLSANTPDDFDVYPNPANDQLFTDLNTPVTVIICNAQGQVVLQQQVAPHQSMDVSALPAGLYVMKAEGRVARFIKK